MTPLGDNSPMDKSIDKFLGDNSPTKTSAEWLKLENGVEILDPDGWDRKNYNYSFNEEKITKQEFDYRLMMSTIGFKPRVIKTTSNDSPTELDKLIPRCKTKDTDDFTDLMEGERCYNCELWEAIDLHVSQAVQEAYKKGYIDGGINTLTEDTPNANQ